MSRWARIRITKPFQQQPPYDTTPVKPAPESPPVVSEVTTGGWPFSAADAIRQQQETAPAGTQGQLTLPLRDADPAKLTTLRLVWIPPGNFVMGSADGHPDERPPHPVLIEKGFWMGRTEITNAQFREYMASHESRTEDRHGYQFGALGYDQDQPGQPAVRVSWDEAAGYCQWLSQKTGRKFTLPTEAQWEWACRAGAANPFWWGGMDTDYSPYANLGDRRLMEFAADTALDNYSAARPMVNPNRYDDWIPHDERFDDGGLVTVQAGQYRPNPWGLNDMHGNAWEWTRSVYRPYPYRPDDAGGNPSGAGTERVVRGGSWHDRPKRCTASFRLAYPQFQKVFNVGFRVVCAE